MASPVSPDPGPEPGRNVFLADVLHGLRRPAKQLPCKYFYDKAGSDLFERICELPEYYLTRAELALMDRHAGEMARLLGPRCLLIEYGCGSAAKTQLLMDRLAEPAAYVPVDLAGAALHDAAAGLARRYPGLPIRPLCADFTRPLQLPTVPAAARRVVYFPGSTVGNFTPRETVALFRQTARLVGPGGGLLLGADLKKAPAVLHAAYNDSRGVTAEFNLNLLRRINRELGADFPVDQFWHHAVYNPRHGRIEMYLVAQGALVVRLGGEQFAFREGEAIRTEYSYKYSRSDVAELAARAGFAVHQVWADGGEFSVQYLMASAV